MSNFVNDVINADALLEQIDDYVEQWHEADTELSVYDYLGMTKEEYIIDAHERNMNINDVLKEEYTLAARSATPEEAKAIYIWLKEKGLVK